MKRSRSALTLGFLLLAASPAAAAPTIEEFPPLPTDASSPQDLVLGPDGNIWFAEKGNNKIGRINPVNPSQLDEYPTIGTAPEIITVGPDGALWFTEEGTNTVGVIAPGAAPTASQVPGSTTGLGDARGIAVGPDGNLWVTDPITPKVIVLAPPGTKVDEIPLPAGFGARGIAKGPDNNMWVAGFTSNSIVRITTAGTPEVNPPNGYPVPDGATPLDVIAGGDGNLWYTAQGTTVGRMTTAGVATNFTSKGGDPFGIALGPDSAVWYAEFQGNSVGRVDAAGNTSNVTGMTGAAGPRYVTAGPGNTLWFTEDTGNRLGRVTGIELPQTTPPPPPPPPPASDTTRPSITRFRITRTVFRLGGLGTVIKWSQSEAARNTIIFHRRVNGRWRRVPRRRMSFNSTAGNHRLRFRGRVSLRRPLRPGRYRMTMTARDAAGNVSSPDRVRFRLLPRARR